MLCQVNYKNDIIDRRVILYLNDCDCGSKYCRENAAYIVKNQLRKASLKDTAVEFMIEYVLITIFVYELVNVFFCLL